MRNPISLMYHDVYVGSPEESGFKNLGALIYKLSDIEFESQIKAIRAYCEIHSVDDSLVRLTFDDGGKSFITNIAPVIEKYNFKGYFFITTGLIDSPGFLTKKDIEELSQRGHYIGAHSHTHPSNIANLSIDQIKYEWCESIKTLTEILKIPIEYASIPGGFFSRESRDILVSLGVNHIFTSKPTSFVKKEILCTIEGRYAIKRGMSTKYVIDFFRSFSINKLKQLVIWEILGFFKLVLGTYYFNLRKNLIKK